jgi:hypothetical protein
VRERKAIFVSGRSGAGEVFFGAGRGEDQKSLPVSASIADIYIIHIVNILSIPVVPLLFILFLLFLFSLMHVL